MGYWPQFVNFGHYYWTCTSLISFGVWAHAYLIYTYTSGESIVHVNIFFSVACCLISVFSLWRLEKDQEMTHQSVLSYFNAHFFGSSLNIRCPTLLPSQYSYYYVTPLVECFNLLYISPQVSVLPQMIFLNSVFGYLSLLWFLNGVLSLKRTFIMQWCIYILKPHRQSWWESVVMEPKTTSSMNLVPCSLLLNTIMFCFLVFIMLYYCSWCADCVIAFGHNCSSMDAFSKTFLY